MLEHGGTVQQGYETVRDAFLDAQARDEGGAQLCVYRDGAMVVDLWAGRDKLNDRPYTDETLTVLMSCTKAVVATCALMLVERGQIDLDAPVARYWPEFAQGGKGVICVRQLLNHSSGLMGLDPETGMGPEDILNEGRMRDALAAMTPLWQPGTACFYHFMTFGTLIAEVIRRVAGKSVGRMIADEISGPLKVDLWLGLPGEQNGRVARHFHNHAHLNEAQWIASFKAMGIDPDTRLMRMLLHTFLTSDAVVDRVADIDTRSLELPAGNAIGNACALAKIYAALIGEVGGIRLISHKMMEQVRSLQTAGITVPPQFAPFAKRSGGQTYGLGFELPSRLKPMLGKGSFGHSGAGGRFGFAHPESGFAVGYACNNMFADPADADWRWKGWLGSLRRIAGLPASG